MKKKVKVYILILSLIAVFGFTFIPDFGVRFEEGTRFYGFPSDLLGLYPSGGFSFIGLGFLFNIAFFYFIFILMFKGFKKVFFTNKQDDKKISWVK